MTAQAGINRPFLAHFSSSLFVLACIICSCHCAALQDTKQELCTSSWGIITEQKSLILQDWPARCLLQAIWVILVLWSPPESIPPAAEAVALKESMEQFHCVGHSGIDLSCAHSIYCSTFIWLAVLQCGVFCVCVCFSFISWKQSP